MIGEAITLIWQAAAVTAAFTAVLAAFVAWAVRA